MTFVWSQDCCEAEEIATNNCGGLGCYIPQCTENCEWEPMQCWSSTGYCWCVDENGEEIEGTSMPLAQKHTETLGSAQVKSAILLAALNTPGITTIEEKKISRNHTENLLTAINANIKSL